MEKLENKKWAIPLLGAVGGLFLGLVVTYPMLSMEVKDIPVAIVSLDESATTPLGEKNIGAEVVEKMTGADNKAIDWRKAGSEAELNENMDAGKYYAALIVPEDFTRANMSGEGAKIRAIVNEGKNPMVTSMLMPMITAMGASGGMEFEMERVNKLPEGMGMKAMFLPMLSVLLTFITSMVTAFLVTTQVVALSGTKEEKAKKYLVQLGYMFAMAFVIGFGVFGVVSWIIGTSIEYVTTALYLTTASLALMLLVNGSVNLLGKKGMAIPGLMFMLGMGLIQVPYEFLPTWHQILVASWEPMRFIGEGIRSVLYQGGAVWNVASPALIVVGVLGVGLSLVSLSKKQQRIDKREQKIRRKGGKK